MVRFKILAAVLFAAGCAAPPAPQSQVASLSTPSSGPASTSASASEEGRPRHRLDESKEESQRINHVWSQCMKDHGADPDTQPPNIEGAKKWSADHKAAGDACRAKLPLPPWSQDPDNPEYKDNMHNWVTCMKDAGMNVAESTDPEMAWTFTSSQQPPDADRIEHDCMIKVLKPKEK